MNKAIIIIIIIIRCCIKCVGVMYSGEYDVCDVTLTVCIHTGQAEKLAWPLWESNPRLLWDTSPMLHQLSYEFKLVGVGDISELTSPFDINSVF